MISGFQEFLPRKNSGNVNVPVLVERETEEWEGGMAEGSGWKQYNREGMVPRLWKQRSPSTIARVCFEMEVSLCIKLAWQGKVPCFEVEATCALRGFLTFTALLHPVFKSPNY